MKKTLLEKTTRPLEGYCAMRILNNFVMANCTMLLAGFLLMAVSGWLLPAYATVFIITPENASFAFEDADAAFGGAIPPPGIRGKLVQAIPFDGCEPFANPVDPRFPTFALIARGNCLFDVKVLNAQLAGYSAAIIFNNEDGNELITMSGRHMWEIYIPAVFVTLNSGKQMLSLASPEIDCFIIPTYDNAAWSVMLASLISLVAVAGVLSTFLYVRRQRLHVLGARILEEEHSGLLAREVTSLPFVTFSRNSLSSATMDTCAICLEDYEEGEKLRLLPCNHEFHIECVDQWLLTRRPFCPVCKRDVRDASQGSTSSEPSSMARLLAHRFTLSSFFFPTPSSSSAQPFLVDSENPQLETSRDGATSQRAESSSNSSSP